MIRTEVAPLVVAVLFVVVAGLLACLEVALARVSRVRVEELVREGRAGAGLLQRVLADPPRSLNLLLLLRLTAELAAAGICTAYCIDRVHGSWAVALAVAIMVVISYIFIGVAPRTIGRQQAERVALVGAPLALGLTRVFGPVPRLLIWLGNALTPGKGFREGPFASEAELRDLVDIAQERGVVEEAERDMIDNVFDLGDTIAREVMVPRTEMVFIERDKTVRQALNLALRSGFSRVPVVGDGADDVLGVAYLKDLVRIERAEGGADRPIAAVMREPRFVPESKPVDDLLREMQTSLGHLAVVIDEYGGTAGLVTMEDVLEEIVGEIVDEYDRERPPVEQLDADTYRVTSRLAVEDLEELFETELPHDDVETVGGLLASALGRVPIPGATTTVNGITLVAETAAGRRNRITTVLASRTGEVRGVNVHTEDDKIVTLARAARLRAHAPHSDLREGAAVRDTDGRTYAAATVENADPGLTTSALRGAVAAAASSGIRSFEAAALVTDGLVSEADLAVLREFGVGVPVHVAGPDGLVKETLHT